MTKLLTDSAFEEIVQHLPSVHQRAALLSHQFVLRDRLKKLEALTESDTVWAEEKKDKKIAELELKVKSLETELSEKKKTIDVLSKIEVASRPAPQVVVEKIVERVVTVANDDVAVTISNWLTSTHQADTVRANYAKKLARMIANGDWK